MYMYISKSLKERERERRILNKKKLFFVYYIKLNKNFLYLHLVKIQPNYFSIQFLLIPYRHPWFEKITFNEMHTEEANLYTQIEAV